MHANKASASSNKHATREVFFRPSSRLLSIVFSFQPIKERDTRREEEEEEKRYISTERDCACAHGKSARICLFLLVLLVT